MMPFVYVPDLISTLVALGDAAPEALKEPENGLKKQFQKNFFGHCDMRNRFLQFLPNPISRPHNLNSATSKTLKSCFYAKLIQICLLPKSWFCIRYAVPAFSFSARQLFDEIKKHHPDFQWEVELEPNMDKFSRLWPNTMSAKEAARDLGITPKFGLPETVQSVLESHWERMKAADNKDADNWTQPQVTTPWTFYVTIWNPITMSS